MHLRFGETESAFDYMMATREYLEQHGKPLAFYSDKHGIFRVNKGGSTTTGNAWLDTFIADFNRRFARPEKYPKDLRLKSTKSSMIFLPSRNSVSCLKR